MLHSQMLYPLSYERRVLAFDLHLQSTGGRGAYLDGI